MPLSPLHSSELPPETHPTLTLEVAGDRGVKLTASIWPTRLTAGHVSGVVDWQDAELMTSVVSAGGDKSPWGQLFLLVWAAVGPQSVSAVPLLGASQWRRANLTLPDIDGRPGGTVRVSLNRHDWTATVSTTRELNFPAVLPISAELQLLDIGSLAAEMASRLLLKKSWLAAGVGPE